MNDERNTKETLEQLGDLEATELSDSDLEDVSGGLNDNCGCGGGTYYPSMGDGNNNCGCGGGDEEVQQQL